MATVTLQGTPANTFGELPAIGSQAKDFTLVKTDLSTISLADLKGSKVVLNIFPSVDTDTCATSVRKFNEKASSYDNTKVLCVSRDLPFALARFCGAGNLKNVMPVSDFRAGQFGKEYGLEFVDGPLLALHSRVVIVLDEEGKILHTEQVAEIVDEPNYEAALKVL